MKINELTHVLLGTALVAGFNLSAMAGLQGLGFKAPTVTSTTGVHGAELGEIVFSEGDNELWVKGNSGWLPLTSELHPTISTKDHTDDDDIILSSDRITLCNAGTSAFRLELPAAAGITGLVLQIKKTDSTTNTVTIDANSSDLIDGAAGTTLNTTGESIRLISDGNNWTLLDRIVPSVVTSFTATGSWGSTTYYGQFKRIGDSAEVTMKAVTSAAQTSALTFTTPFTIDTAKLITTTNNHNMGQCTHMRSGVEYLGRAKYGSSTTIYPTINKEYYTGYTQAYHVDGTNTPTISSDDTVECRFTIPVSGWN